MNGSEIAQIITSIAALIAAMGSTMALIQSFRNGRKSAIIDGKISDVVTNVAALEVNTNSKMDALLAAKVQAATAEGTATGLAQGTAAGLEQGRKEERK